MNSAPNDPANTHGSSPSPSARGPIEPPPLRVLCRRCGRGIGGGDAFCKHCGTRQQVSDPFYYHPVWILVLAFFVLGPFALGLVWRSQAMGREMKLLLTAVIVIYSAFTIYATYEIGIAMYREMSILNQLM